MCNKDMLPFNTIKIPYQLSTVPLGRVKNV